MHTNSHSVAHSDGHSDTRSHANRDAHTGPQNSGDTCSISGRCAHDITNGGTRADSRTDGHAPSDTICNPNGYIDTGTNANGDAHAYAHAGTDSYARKILLQDLSHREGLRRYLYLTQLHLSRWPRVRMRRVDRKALIEWSATDNWRTH